MAGRIAGSAGSAGSAGATRVSLESPNEPRSQCAQPAEYGDGAEYGLERQPARVSDGQWIRAALSAAGWPAAAGASAIVPDARAAAAPGEWPTRGARARAGPRRAVRRQLCATGGG